MPGLLKKASANTETINVLMTKESTASEHKERKDEEVGGE